MKTQAEVPYVLGRRTGRTAGNWLYCYVDADFANCAETRRSNTGYLIFLDGSLIAFVSKRQSGVALSTTDAEVRAATAACKEILWVVRLIDELGFAQKQPVDVMEDNSATVTLSQSSGAQHSGRIKYMSIRDKFCLNLAQDGVVRFVKVTTDQQIADVLTKPFFKPKFTALRTKLWNPRALRLQLYEDVHNVYVVTRGKS